MKPFASLRSVTPALSPRGQRLLELIAAHNTERGTGMPLRRLVQYVGKGESFDSVGSLLADLEAAGMVRRETGGPAVLWWIGGGR